MVMIFPNESKTQKHKSLARIQSGIIFRHIRKCISVLVCVFIVCFFFFLDSWTLRLKKNPYSFIHSSRQICTMSSSDLTQWNLPKRNILWAFPVLSPRILPPPPHPGSSPCRWIEDQMRHLSSDHFNSHLASGADKEQKTVGSFFSPFPLLSPSLQNVFEGKCLLGPFSSYIRRCLSHDVKNLGRGKR